MGIYALGEAAGGGHSASPSGLIGPSELWRRIALRAAAGACIAAPTAPTVTLIAAMARAMLLCGCASHQETQQYGPRFSDGLKLGPAPRFRH